MDMPRTIHLARAEFLSRLEALAIIRMAMGIVGVGEGTAEEDSPTNRELNQKTDPSRNTISLDANRGYW